MLIQYSLLVLTIAVIIWLNVRLIINSRGYKKDFYKFIEDERTANMARKKDIPAEFFIKPDVSRLPVKNYAQQSRLASKQEAALKSANNTMIKFNTPKTNREIKLEFGLANLDNVINYEENYQQYIRKLTDWAEQLILEGYIEDGQKVLLEAIEFGADSFICFKLLNDTCFSQNNFTILEDLFSKIQNNLILKDNMDLRNKVTDCFEKTLGGSK